MELTYTKAGDYYIPDLALDDDTEYEIGIYGWMRERFLKEHHSGIYKPNPHWETVETPC